MCFYVVLLHRLVWRCCVALPKIAIVMGRILMWAAYLLIYQSINTHKPLSVYV